MRGRRRESTRRTTGLADRRSSREGISGDRSGRQRYRARDAHAAPLDQPDQGQLQRLSSDGQPGDARDPESARTFASSVAAWDTRVQVGQDGQGMSNMVTAWDAGAVSTCSPAGRIGSRAATSRRCRLVRRVSSAISGDHVGLGWSGDVRARRADDRQAQPHRQRLRADLWRRLGQRRIPDRRSAGTFGAGDSDPVLDPKVPPGKAQSMPVPSPYWGDKRYRFDPAITNHAAMDGKGRVWMSSRFRRPEDQPAFCGTHPSAALAPQKSSFRQVQYFDPKTRQFKQVNICFDTHHVQFAGDKDETCTATASSVVQSGGSTRASSTRRGMKPRRRAGAAAITI